jgi:hypothetical protein
LLGKRPFPRAEKALGAALVTEKNGLPAEFFVVDGAVMSHQTTNCSSLATAVMAFQWLASAHGLAPRRIGKKECIP